MKILSNVDAVELCACPPNMASAAAATFDDFAPVDFEAGLLDYACNEGFVRAEQVLYNGQPAFVMFWSKSLDNGLSINAAQTLKAVDCPVDVAFIAAEKIRARENCKFTRFATRRAGLLEHSRQHGFRFETVLMKKA